MGTGQKRQIDRQWMPVVCLGVQLAKVKTTMHSLALQFEHSFIPTLDVEASGFGAGSYPIEVGVVLADRRSYCTLVKPEPEWQHWDAAAESVHGISRDTLMRHGKPAKLVADQLNAFLYGMTVYTDAWSQDYSWMNRLYHAVGRIPRFKLASLTEAIGEVESSRWNSAKATVVARTRAKRHRASADARVLQDTVHELLAQRR